MNKIIMILIASLLSGICFGQGLIFETDSTKYVEYENVKARLINCIQDTIYLTPLKEIHAVLFRYNENKSKWEDGTWVKINKTKNKEIKFNYELPFQTNKILPGDTIKVDVNYWVFVDAFHKTIAMDSTKFHTDKGKERTIKGNYKLKLRYSILPWYEDGKLPTIIDTLESNVFQVINNKTYNNKK